MTFADDVRAALRAPGALMIPADVRRLLQDAAGHIDALEHRIAELERRLETPASTTQPRS